MTTNWLRKALVLLVFVAASAPLTSAAGDDWENVPARAFLRTQDRVIRLDSGRPEICFQLEPMNSSFDIHAFDLSAIKLLREQPGTSGVSKILVIEARVDRDTDRNGVDEIRACFSKADMRQLLSDVNGPSLVPIRIYGNPNLPSPLNSLEVHMVVEVLGDGSYHIRPTRKEDPPN